MRSVGHTPSTAGNFRRKFRKNSGKTPETLSERFLEFPSRVRLGCPKPYNSRHLRLPERFQNSLPPSTAQGASFFRIGSGEGLSEPGHGIPSSTGGISDTSYSCVQALTVTPRGSSAGCRLQGSSRPGRREVCIRHVLAMLHASGCTRWDPKARSSRSVWQRNKACLVGQGAVVYGRWFCWRWPGPRGPFCQTAREPLVSFLCANLSQIVVTFYELFLWQVMSHKQSVVFWCNLSQMVEHCCDMLQIVVTFSAPSPSLRSWFWFSPN